ncbi:hypothetical protein HanRHA438_Chr02g0057951 [Helianthus annuus]|nr:hypothetical protein HanHA300_Chr02g0046271 [Helianthus annuus]KAJ0776614.1 hypothetical protein HanLR1_Chr02g0047641 [Helianthus annuus]KAJ0939160.1 hypothetical protein HanRHA438_Chr02g0057951 [Helianthus annuus]
MISRTNPLITYRFCLISYHHTSTSLTSSNHPPIPPAPLLLPQKNLTLVDSIHFTNTSIILTEPIPPPAHPLCCQLHICKPPPCSNTVTSGQDDRDVRFTVHPSSVQCGSGHNTWIAQREISSSWPTVVRKKKRMKQLKLQNPQIQVVQPLMMIKEKIRGSLVSWNYSTNSWMVTRLKSPARIKSNQVNLRGLTDY